MGITGFKGSNGFLCRWKARYKVDSKNIHGEAADCPDTKEWLEATLPCILAQYEPRDIYNADETGLFFRITPDRTFAFLHEHVPGRKVCKDRLTLLLCCNMDGSHRWKPVVLGKVKKPRRLAAVHHITPGQLPVTYRSNKKAWMTGPLFAEFMHSFNSYMSHMLRKVILFLDNAPSHMMQKSWSNVRVEFLPANTTSKLQPIDQGIIKSLKGRYRADLAKKYLIALNAGKSVHWLKQQIDLKVACDMIVQAWRDIPGLAIINSFKKAGFAKRELRPPGLFGYDALETNSGFDMLERNIWEQVAKWNHSSAEKVDFMEYVEYEEKLDEAWSGAQEYTIDEIVEQYNDPTPEGESDDEVVDVVAPRVMHSADALAHVADLRSFCQRHGIATEHLDRFEKNIIFNKITSMKQTHIQDAIRAANEKIDREREIEKKKEELAKLQDELERKEKAEQEKKEKVDKVVKLAEKDQARIDRSDRIANLVSRNPLIDRSVLAALVDGEDKVDKVFTVDLGVTSEELANMPGGLNVSLISSSQETTDSVEIIEDPNTSRESVSLLSGQVAKFANASTTSNSGATAEIVKIATEMDIDPQPGPSQTSSGVSSLPSTQATQDSEGWEYSVTDTGNMATVDSQELFDSPDLSMYESDGEGGLAKLISGLHPSVSQTTKKMSQISLTQTSAQKFNAGLRKISTMLKPVPAKPPRSPVLKKLSLTAQRKNNSQ